jgi:hypothetical protein
MFGSERQDVAGAAEFHLLRDPQYVLLAKYHYSVKKPIGRRRRRRVKSIQM